VSPKGEIVWEGHPSGLDNSTIEEQLKYVRLTPTFDLPKALRSAERYLNGGRFASGMKALERYLKRPKDEEDAKAAREALEKVQTYGKDKLKEVEELAKEGYYGDGMRILELLEKAFKGTEIGDQAKEKQSAWKKDDKISAEIKASLIVEKARELIRAKSYRTAYALLLRVLKSDKYEETKSREVAEELRMKIRKYL
jgi:hypothetical protein